MRLSSFQGLNISWNIRDEIIKLQNNNKDTWNSLASETRAFIGSIYGGTKYDSPKAVITQSEGNIERWKARMFILRLLKSRIG